jgi:putative transposase
MAKRMFEYRIYPSIKQTNRLKKQFFLVMKLYNLLLLLGRDQYQANGENLSHYDMNHAITRIKELDTKFSEVHSQVLQNVSDRINKAYKNFFRRLKELRKGKNVKVGFPRYKKFLKSITYPQSGFKFVSDKLVYIGKVGNVPIVKHRPTVGTIKTMSVKWTRSGKWFVVFCCEIPDDPKIVEKLEVSKKEWSFKHEIGIDMGLEKFLATSDNGIVENPRFLNKATKRLVRLQRRLSRKTKGSKNRKKARLKLAREQERVANQRKDFHWKVAHYLVATYDLIAIEGLNINKMLKDHRLARQISDVGWGDFIRILGYLAGSAGVLIVVVDPAGTSQECSSCHAIVPKDLSVRIHRCPHCGLVLDRDVNSARIILYVARSTAGLAGTYACGDIATTLWLEYKACDVGETRTIFV